MGLSIDTVWKMPEVELIATYYGIRRQYVEAKFTRDTQRARLEWQKARAFAAGAGGVTERRNAVESSEELARKGQELREMTRNLDLLRADLDVLAMIVRLRGAPTPDDAAADDSADGERTDEVA